MAIARSFSLLSLRAGGALRAGRSAVAHHPALSCRGLATHSEEVGRLIILDLHLVLNYLLAEKNRALRLPYRSWSKNGAIRGLFDASRVRRCRPR